MPTPAAQAAPAKRKHGGGNQAATAWIRHHKNVTPCADCGERYPWWMMDADHIDGTTARERAASGQARAGRNPAAGSPGGVGTANHTRLRRDLQEGRAEIVCANCHRQRTHERRLGL